MIVRSILDRTLFVLGRAAMVAAPAGLIIWLMANITVGNAACSLTAPIPGSLRQSVWSGRCDFHGLSFGIPCQRDCVSHHHHGLSGYWKPHGFIRIRGTENPAGEQWMDVADRCVHHLILLDALALLHHLHDHCQGEQKLKVDRYFFCCPNGHRTDRV